MRSSSYASACEMSTSSVERQMSIAKYPTAYELLLISTVLLTLLTLISFFTFCEFLSRHGDYTWHLSTALNAASALVMLASYNPALLAALHERFAFDVRRHP